MIMHRLGYLNMRSVYDSARRQGDDVWDKRLALINSIMRRLLHRWQKRKNGHQNC